MRFQARTVRGVVFQTVDNEITVKTELGSLIMNWKNNHGFKLGERVLVFYDFEKGKVRNIVREGEVSEHVEGEEREDEFESGEEEEDLERILDLIEGGELNS